MDCLVNFENLPWEQISTGMRLKTFKKSNQQIQLIELSEGFFEQDWCLHSHTNYVLDGEFTADFDGEEERYKKGDCIFIPKDTKHKAILGKGKKVILLDFKTIAD